MQSSIIISKNKKTALDFIESECKKNQIDKFDINLLTFEKAIGIEDIRNFQKQLFLKPMRSKTKAITLEAYNGITTEAQNALLKVLEEPPNNTIIYIASQNKNVFLPTILSRCKIIELKDKSFELSEEEIAQYLSIITSLSQKGIGERLKLAQDITKNKGETTPWLEKMIIIIRKTMIENVIKNGKNNPLISPPADEAGSYLNILISFQKTHTILSTTNANQRLVLENLFLNM